MTAFFVRPITLRAAAAFVNAHHRHNKAPRGHKFSIALHDVEGALVGVACAGRPVARSLDDGLTLEVSRTCTLGDRNANSTLYGAVRRAAWAMGYQRLVTYTQASESGDSLRGAGFVRVADLPARASWADSSIQLRDMRDPDGPGGVARVRWEIGRSPAR